MRFWDQEVECFIIYGEWIEITLLDVYFLTGFPMLGVSSDTTSKLTHGVSLDDLCDRNSYASSSMHTLYILVCDIESLHILIEAMVLCILGSSIPHKISSD